MRNAISFLLQAYLVICVIRVALSWLGSMNDNPILSFVSTITYALTEPVFATVRRALPPMGDLPFDLSPMIVIFGIYVLQALIS